jgi:hypothetical protein
MVHHCIRQSAGHSHCMLCPYILGVLAYALSPDPTGLYAILSTVLTTVHFDGTPSIPPQYDQAKG